MPTGCHLGISKIGIELLTITETVFNNPFVIWVFGSDKFNQYFGCSLSDAEVFTALAISCFSFFME